MIGLIGAMAVEVEALEKKLEGRRETTIGMDTFVSGKLFGQDAVLAVCGPGKVNAAVCTQKMITAFSPDWVLNLGVAGADFENDSDFRPSRARCCLRFRLCRSIRCVYRLLITCSFPFRRDSYSGQPSVIHITTSKGDSRLIRRPSVAIVRSPNTCATTVFRSLSYA